MTIPIKYPMTDKKIIKTEAEARALGYKSEISRTEPVNRSFRIRVKGKTIDNDKLCLELTGMTPKEYQLKNGIAWSE